MLIHLLYVQQSARKQASLACFVALFLLYVDTLCLCPPLLIPSLALTRATTILLLSRLSLPKNNNSPNKGELTS